MGQFGFRLAIDGRPAMRPRTGIGTIVRNVLRRIAQVDHRCEVSAYFDADPGDIGPLAPQVRCAFGGSRQEFIWSNLWLPRRLRRDGIDVFVTFADKEIPLLPTASKIVMMVHDLIPLRMPEVVFRNAAHRWYYNTLIRAAVRRADLVLTNSEFSRSEILSVLGVDGAKVHRISLGVEQAPRVMPAAVEAALARHGLRRPYVLTLGSTEPRKNVARVMQAMRLLAPRHAHVQLAIAGGLWRGVPYDKALLDQRIVPLGHVSDDDLRAVMSAAGLLAFPSLHEGFGFPVLEAMAAGVPVVTSDRTALPEVGGDAVLYANPESAADIAANMDRILSDEELATRLRAKGRERAHLFRWEDTCAEIVDLCASLMRTRSWERQAAVR
jgi:glycosyltransferase involved in cell wall biosynthesis